MGIQKRIAILGSTGSIGTQALDVVGQNPDLFDIELLTAHSNVELLVSQCKLYKPKRVVITDESKYIQLKTLLSGLPIEIVAGAEAVDHLVITPEIDMVLTAMVGFSGLSPTVSAVRAGKSIALANKETLVAAGEIITKLAKESGSKIIPVDSEHSAIFQCLNQQNGVVERILLTASGGPFLNKNIEDLKKVKVEEALKHPKWQMGNKVTIDSSTMMNKGLELIEAKWLFDMDPSKIEMVVHPQSIIHSMVEFSDGTILAQMSIPDMRVPISYALSYPNRVSLNTARIDFHTLSKLDFYSPDRTRFPSISLAYNSIERGGNIPCAMNAANEIAVASFLREEISYWSIPQITEEVLERIDYIKTPSLESIFETDLKARELAKERVIKHNNR